MARFEVIKEVSDSLANVIAMEAKAQKFDLEVVVGAPDADFFKAKGNRVAVHLHQLEVDHSENQEHAKEIIVEAEDEQGSYTIIYPSPIALRLYYLVAAAGKTASDEQLALAIALKAFVEHPVLNDELKKGSNFPKENIPVDLDSTFTPERQVALLQSLGAPHHPLLGYKVNTQLAPERELRRTRRVERRGIGIYDRHRLPDSAFGPPEAPVERPDPKAKDAKAAKK